MTKILLVDDEPEVLSILSKRLQSAGYGVVTAADGKEGLEKVRAEKPDIILLDVMMPGKDGFSMLSEMQSEDSSRKIPVIMVTARGDSRDIFQGQYLGAIDYLIKPVDFEELLKYVRKYT